MLNLYSKTRHRLTHSGEINSTLGIPSAVDHFEAMIKAVTYQSSIPTDVLYVGLFMLRLGTHSKA